MGQLSHVQYEQLENAVAQGLRISLFRRGTEYMIIPTAVSGTGARESLSARHSTTGEKMTFFLDEIDRFEVVER